jgi:enoyl-CoA hydratase/carnithine racemase
MTDLTKLEACTYTVVDNIAVVTMNRPDRLNSLDTTMHRDVDACWDEINANPAIRAAVITGNGRFFCAGRDIKEYLNTYGEEEQNALRPIDDPDHPLFARLCNHYIVEKPLIGALNGPAVGAGLEIAIMCDMLVMADNAYIADLHAKVNVGGMNTLLWYMPPMIARELAMTDRRLTPEECLRIGFVNRVVPPEDVLESALDLARKTTMMGPDSIRMLRQGSIRRQMECGLVWGDDVREERRKSARARIAEMQQNPDHLAGMKAFAEKRQAEYVKPS